MEASVMRPMPAALLDQRVQVLADFYRRVQHERMQGIALLNPALVVEAVGFEWAPSEDDGEGRPAVAEGILVTPWFMSLVRLPAAMEPHQGRVGRSRVHDFGAERFDFIGAHDPATGFHETCALFSPMADFPTQDLARETAREALALLRPAPVPAAADPRPMPARRAFFLARGSRDGDFEGARP